MSVTLTKFVKKIKAMKKNQSLFVLSFILFIIILSSSCKKTIEEIADDITPSFSCTIDGLHWSSHTTAGTLNDTGIVVTAYKDSTIILLSLNNSNVGSYDIDNVNTLASYSPDGSLNTYLAIDGMIEIKEITTNIKTIDLEFNMMAVNLALDTIYITNGVGSNILYTE